MHQSTLLTRRVAEVIEKKHLENRLHSSKKLRIKLGIDPTGAELHLGHAVPLWKLREFQEAGHKAVFIIGDWTAMIGDPSGKDLTRKPLTSKQVQANSKHFFQQANLILDKSKTEIHYQSEWFKKFGLAEVIHLSSLVTEKQLLAHETFRNRMEKDLPFFHHETLYPLLQGYDSVAVKASVELGAIEQKFNVLMGRTIQRAYGQPGQDVILLDYLIGLDGKEKMSKSLNNYIALTHSAEEMYGKIMSLPDRLIMHYFELCTNLPEKEMAALKKQLDDKGNNPKLVKMRLALEIAQLYHGKKVAQEAAKNFDRKFRSKATAEIKADYELRKPARSYSYSEFLSILVAGHLANSRSEAVRKIIEGAVRIDGIKVSENQTAMLLGKNTLISLGKRFLRII